jgi:dienelactone hydrolase
MKRMRRRAQDDHFGQCISRDGEPSPGLGDGIDVVGWRWSFRSAILPNARLIGCVLVLCFLGALFWATRRDVFSRKWFTVRARNDRVVHCAMVFPKFGRGTSRIIYAHGARGTLSTDGRELRQMAESGLSVLSFDYDETNPQSFDRDFDVVLRYVGQNKVQSAAWVGFSLGATLMLNYALQHPEAAPQLLVGVSTGGGTEPLRLISQRGSCRAKRFPQDCAILLIHGEEDELFPVQETKELSTLLQRDGLSVALEILPKTSHGLGPDRSAVFRCIGETCLRRLEGNNSWRNYRRSDREQRGAAPLVLVGAVVLVYLGWRAWPSTVNRRLRQNSGQCDIALRWGSVLLFAWASTETVIHLAVPQLSVRAPILPIVSKCLVHPRNAKDLQFLLAKASWDRESVRCLIEHVELTAYNRRLTYWTLEDALYQEYVMSPIISGTPAEDLDWRALLWGALYPHVRNAKTLDSVARSVVRHLRERVTIAPSERLSLKVRTMWQRQLSDEKGFERLCVAGLRSVGVPARLALSGDAEYWNGNVWSTAPKPLLFEAKR